jgi:ABC-type Fe3+-hydroxamate transport system substrate-binding protein
MCAVGVPALLVLGLAGACSSSGSHAEASTTTSSTTSPVTTSSPPSSEASSVSTPVTPSITTATPTEQVYAIGVSITSGKINYNEVQYYTGRAAVRECTKAGLRVGQSPWCSVYYWKDTNPLVRHTPLAKRVTVEVPGFLAGNSKSSSLTPTTLEHLEKLMAARKTSNLFRLTISNGAVSKVTNPFIG